MFISKMLSLPRRKNNLPNKGVVFCDIDNSFYDIESAMLSKFDDYPINTDSYALDEKFIRAFNDTTLYNKCYINKEVLSYLQRKQKEGYSILFYSQSVSYPIHLVKKSLVIGSFPSSYLFPITVDEDLLTLWNQFSDKGNIIFVDDKPSRIELLKSLTEVTVVGVLHPYNKNLLKGLRTLKPNYIEGEL